MSWENLLSGPGPGQHLVQLYRDERFFATAVGRFIAEGLGRGECVIAVLGEAHRGTIADTLRGAGCDVKAPLNGARLRLLDLQTILKRIVRNGVPQWSTFREVFAPMIAGGLRAQGRVRVFGGMVDVLWCTGRRDVAAQLEQFWSDLAREQPFSLLCAYCVDNLQRSVYGGPLECICKAHSHIIPAHDYAGFNSAVGEAALHVLGAPLAAMLATLSRRHKPAAEMPLAQAMLLWLGGNMPHTAEKVMRRVRERLSAEEAAPQGEFAGNSQASVSQ